MRDRSRLCEDGESDVSFVARRQKIDRWLDLLGVSTE
jgi:hypothetical protein